MMKLSTIETGFFQSDGGAIFGLVPKTIWSRLYPSDPNNRCEMSMRCLLAYTDDRRILFDTGAGNKEDARTIPYHFHNLTDLREAIQKKGIKPEEITDIVLSHLHFDHCGALSHLDKEGHLCESFPNATYHISRRQWEHHLNPSQFDRNAYIAENTSFLTTNRRLHLIDSDFQLTNQIRLSIYEGHTPGQIVSFIQQDEQYFVFAGDVLPTSLHLRLEAISAFDSCATISKNEKKRLLEEIREKKARILFYHDAFVCSAEIKKTGTVFRPVEIKKNKE